MQPDSLVFVAILGAWAAYLLPRWVTRRDALGQSRTRDRHSVHMRVLVRRRRRVAGASSAPLLKTAPSLSARGPAEPAEVAAGAAPSAQRPAGRPAAPSGRPGKRPVPLSPAARAARRRARVLLVLLLACAGSWAVAVATSAPVWVAYPATAVLALDLVGLVLAGRRRAAARRAVARDVARRMIVAQRRLATQGTSPQTRSTRHAQPEGAVAAIPLARGRRGTMGGQTGGKVGGQTGGQVGASGDVTQELPAVAAAGSAVAAARRVADTTGTWTPVAVPPPTYTLKPVVPRPEPRPLDLPAAPAATASVAAMGSARPWENEHSWADDLDDVLARRRAVNG